MVFRPSFKSNCALPTFVELPPFQRWRQDYINHGSNQRSRGFQVSSFSVEQVVAMESGDFARLSSLHIASPMKTTELCKIFSR